MLGQPIHARPIALLTAALLTATAFAAPPWKPSDETGEKIAVAAPPTVDSARELQSAGKYAEAAKVWVKIVEAEPDNGFAWFNLAYCMHAVGQLEKAVTLHKKAATFDDFRGIALYNLGCAHALLGHPDKAFAALDASREAGFDVRGSAGDDSDLDSLRDDPRYDALLAGAPMPEVKAKPMTKLVKPAEKTAGPPSVGQAQALQGAGDFAEAAKAWAAIAKADPENGAAWFNLAYCTHGAGELEKAIELHKKAASFDAYHGIAMYNLGCAYALLGRHDEALEALAEGQEAGFSLVGREDDTDLDSLRDDPRFIALLRSAPIEPQQIQMLVERIAGRVEGIIQDLAPEIEYHVGSLMQQAMMAGQELYASFQERVSRDRELMGMVRQLFDGVEEMGSGDRDLVHAIQMARGWFEQNYGRGGDGGGGGGGGIMHRAPAEAPEAPATDAMPSMATAQQLQGAGDWAGAAKAYGAIAKAEPDNVGANFLHAYCLHMSGAYEEAIPAHRRAAEFEQVRPVALYNLGCAYALTGKKDKAFEALEAARKAGFDLGGSIGSDSDLDSLRDDPRFLELMAKIEADI